MFICVYVLFLSACLFSVASIWLNYLRAEEQEISSRMDEQAQLHLDAAESRARAEAAEKDLSEKQTKKLIKEYQKQVICGFWSTLIQ